MIRGEKNKCVEENSREYKVKENTKKKTENKFWRNLTWKGTVQYIKYKVPVNFNFCDFLTLWKPCAPRPQDWRVSLTDFSIFFFLSLDITLHTTSSWHPGGWSSHNSFIYVTHSIPVKSQTLSKVTANKDTGTLTAWHVGLLWCNHRYIQPPTNMIIPDTACIQRRLSYYFSSIFRPEYTHKTRSVSVKHSPSHSHMRVIFHFVL